ncbi:helix-turn-helix domain-containing protein [Rhodococcus erythropolis]|uniref:helix-turn-helix domain-containing protein n=1 Tax=Rhodococcus erythropolis TaxID=1833 RepID=UPI00382FAA87
MASANRRFAEQLNILFAQSRYRTTNIMVAHALTERGCTISAPYLSQLRNGVRTRPADRYVQAIARYFDVSLSHFYDAPFECDPQTTLDQDLELIDAVNDTVVRQLLRNAHGLSPASMDLLVQFENHLNALR